MTTALHNFRHTHHYNSRRGLYKGCRKPVLNRVQTSLTMVTRCRSTPHTGRCRLLHAPTDSTPIRVSAVALTGFPDSFSLLLDSPVASNKYRESASALPFSLPVRYWMEYWKDCSARLQRLSLLLFSLRRSSHSKDRWSVWMVKERPSRYTRNI